MNEEQAPIEMKVEAREGSVIKNVTQIIGGRYPLLKDFVYEFKECIEEHTKRFVGREFIFQELDKFRENYSCGYFRVIADAGLGKTAIAAAVANQYDAPIFFVNASEGWVSPSQCLQHLCAVLIARYKLKHTYLPERSGDDANFLSQLLREAAEQEAKKEEPGPIWVVVDALDEAESPSGRNILLLSSQLPDGVYFLLTHRPGSYNIQLTGNTRSVEYEVP